VKTRILVQVIATIVVLVFAAGIWWSGGRVDVGWLRFFSAAVFVATGMLWVWEKVLWKTSPIQRLRWAPRDLTGTWKGTLETFWKDPSTGRSIPPKTGYLVVRQSASALFVILLTGESRSVSTLAVVSSGEGIAFLDYIYVNRPDSEVEDRSRMHHGSASLDIKGRPATRLRGRYWTDRDTKGQLDFAERRRQAAEDFEEAERIFA
jgi:hypothetical protein